MRKKLFYPTIALALLLGFDFAVYAQTSSTNYRIPSSVLSSGGTTMDSASFQVKTTIGQSSCIGLSSKRDYITYAGFWQPTKLEIKGKAMPWLPLLLLDN